MTGVSELKKRMPSKESTPGTFVMLQAILWVFILNQVLLAILSLKELALYGSGRIGLAQVNASQTNYVYELADHLGNVRATVQKDTDGSLKLVSAADYYPFGMLMPNKTTTPGEYRFGYQGQFAEKDEETGYNQFELRLWMDA